MKEGVNKMETLRFKISLENLFNFGKYGKYDFPTNEMMNKTREFIIKCETENLSYTDQEIIFEIEDKEIGTLFGIPIKLEIKKNV